MVEAVLIIMYSLPAVVLDQGEEKAMASLPFFYACATYTCMCIYTYILCTWYLIVGYIVHNMDVGLNDVSSMVVAHV